MAALASRLARQLPRAQLASVAFRPVARRYLAVSTQIPLTLNRNTYRTRFTSCPLAIHKPWTGRTSQMVVFRSMGSFPAHQVVGLPALSPTMEQGTIAAWCKKEGESFGPGDVICEVETDKATVSFEAQEDGVVAKILVQAKSGEVKVGQPIMVVVEDASTVGSFASFTLGDASGGGGAAAPAPSAPAAAPAAAAPAATSAPSATVQGGGRVFASPLAKTVAGQGGIDLASVPGTGPGGRVIAADVKEFVPPVKAAAPATAAPSAPAPARAAPGKPVSGAGYTDYPISETAREIADNLTYAKQNVPHYYLTVDLLLDKLLAVRAQLNKNLPDGEKVSVNDLLIKASALASKKVPDCNGSWQGDFVRQYHNVDINVFIGVGDGLVAPVLRNADTKGVKVISDEVRKLIKGTEEGGLPADAFQPGTMSLINVGQYQVKSIAPIVNLPQACFVGIGAIENVVIPKEKPKEGEDIYEVVPGVTVTLSCDHRVIDGATGAQWLQAFKSLVEDPMTLLL